MARNLVLLVEDQYDHAVMIQAMLDFHHLADRTFVAQDVAEGRAYLEGHWPFTDRVRDPLPDLIILDHWLPDGTSLDLLEWIALEPELHTIPVVVFTACEDPVVERRVLELGVKAYITKEHGVEDLAAAVKSLSDEGFHADWALSLQRVLGLAG